MPGEPIVLDYVVTNSSSREAMVGLADRGRGWLILEMVDAAGRKTPAMADPGPQDRKQALNGNGFVMSANSQSPGQIVVTDLLAPPRPGTYRLNIHVVVPYIIGTATGTLSLRALPQIADTFMVKDYSFPLTITAADPRRLRAVAQAFKEAAVTDIHEPAKATSEDSDRRRNAVIALFSMPAEYALPSWRALLTDPRLEPQDYNTVIDQLYRLGSAQAADFAAEMAWSSSISAQRKSGMKRVLFQIHQRADAALKQHIESLFIRYQDQMPPNPMIQFYG